MEIRLMEKYYQTGKQAKQRNRRLRKWDQTEWAPKTPRALGSIMAGLARHCKNSLLSFQRVHMFLSGWSPSHPLPVLCRNSQQGSKETCLFMESKPQRKRCRGFEWLLLGSKGNQERSWACNPASWMPIPGYNFWNTTLSVGANFIREIC